ncbi:hypothetical protein OICFNHDK_3336 [Methylobacterium bullatum]|uniref:Uncharacterized protein n=1 Tax=Methylobacterium bullatum TaxID=570505 RepID=A0AAV4ZAC8_9HYPH|nr:hypothetical protein [Methylobacterium bullatum]GJD40860.1 hypothetical protein OICFNHDK_3336 [Methylobacterium bullatum]
MPRPCLICAHPNRAAIDAALTAGASLDEVLATFQLPSRSSLQRHRAGHLGREVTFHFPPTAAPTVQGPGTPSTGGVVSSEAALEQLFARANADTGRTLQDYARLLVDGLAHIYAASAAADDRGVAVRALRELRGFLQFQVSVQPDRLRQSPGWVEPEQERDPIFALERLLLAGTVGAGPGVEEALAELDGRWPGFAQSWNAENPAP